MKSKWVLVWCVDAFHEQTNSRDGELLITAQWETFHLKEIDGGGAKGWCPSCDSTGCVMVRDVQAASYNRGNPVEMAPRCSCKARPASPRAELPSSKQCPMCKGWGFVVPATPSADAAARLGAAIQVERARPWDWRGKWTPPWVHRSLSEMRAQKAIAAAQLQRERADREGPMIPSISPYKGEYGQTHWQTGRRKKRFNQGHRGHRPRK